MNLHNKRVVCFQVDVNNTYSQNNLKEECNKKHFLMVFMDKHCPELS